MSFLVYKSSAGSGKTFTLVREYLKIALSSSDAMNFSKILAITFTNKAANEMTDRILETLEEMSGVVQPMQDRTLDLMGMLADDLKIDMPELKLRSRNTLKKIVHNYREFSVGTIDSFVHRIIRSFASEMGLNQQFEIELNAEGVLKRAVDMMLERVGEDKLLTVFIEEYVNEKFEEGKTWKIDKDLYDFAKGLQNSHEWYFLDKAKKIDLTTYHEKYRILQTSVRGYEKKLTDIAEKAVAYALNGMDKKKYAHGGQFIGFFEKILNLKFTEPAGANVLDLVEKESKKWFAPSKTKKDEQAVINERKPKLLAWYMDIIAIREDEEANYLFESILYKNIYRVALLTEIQKEVEKIKVENDLVLISDFTELVGKITRNEPVPFIYEKLGERYTHFLFDEFQDTSLMQWHNMLPLVENSLAQMGTSLVVGDAKQSIYRWRGGVVEQFSGLPEVYNPYQDPYVDERAISLKVNFEHRNTLNTNFRSKSNIIRFNNAFFEKAKGVFEKELGNYYEDVSQIDRKNNEEGYVQFKFFEGPKKEDLIPDIFEYILQTINNVVNDGYDYKDIAILTKRKKETPALVEFLNGKGINVLSSESLLVNNSLIVKLVVATLQYLNQPNEPFYMSELLIRLNEIKERPGFHSLIMDLKNITEAKFNLILMEWGILLERQSLLSLPLYELVSGIVEVFGFHNVKDNRLASWMDYVYQLSLKVGWGIFDLLDDWKNQRDSLSIQIPEDINAVNILTIHKSKGLDWPVVIVAEGNWVKSITTHAIWVDVPNEIPIPVCVIGHNKKLIGTVFENDYIKEEEKIILDNLNALYVAFTRPADRLYVMCNKPQTQFFKPLYDIVLNFDENDRVDKTMDTYKGKPFLSEFNFGKKELNKRIAKTSTVELKHIKNQKNSLYRKKLKVKKNYLKWLNDAGERDFGNTVHKAFSFIETIDDVESAIDKLIAAGDIEWSEREEFNALLKEVISNNKMKPFFKKGLIVRNEAEIITSNGDLFRPDRFIQDGEQAIVIDYKTGMRRPAHDEQVLGYKMKLQEMGYASVKAILIYTADLAVIEL